MKIVKKVIHVRRDMLAIGIVLLIISILSYLVIRINFIEFGAGFLLGISFVLIINSIKTGRKEIEVGVIE